MPGEERNRRSGLWLVVLIVAGLWVLTGIRAGAAFSDAHNASLVAVPATLSACGQSGCLATFTLEGHRYRAFGASGRDGQRVTIYVNPQDPYAIGQRQPWLPTYGPFLLVVGLTLVALLAWTLRRRARVQRSRAASRS